MATKRLGAAKKRRRNSTLIANPRRKKRKRKANPTAKHRRRKSAAPKRRRKTTLAKRGNPRRKRALARRKARRNPGGNGNFKSMLKDLPILEIAVAGATAIFVSNLVAGVPFVSKKIGEMEEGTTKDIVGGLVGPTVTFAAGLGVMHFASKQKSAKAKKIGQFIAYAALFQATNAVVGAQVKKGVASVLKTIAGDEDAPTAPTAPTTTSGKKGTDLDGGFGGAWIGPSGAQYGGLLGAAAYFTPDDDDFGGAYMSDDFGGAYMLPDTPIKIAGFGGFN